jgi:hypothetical protein
MDPNRKVQLVQPQFPEKEVLFIEAYFGHFVKRYRLAFSLPEWIGKPYEKWLDHRVTSKWVPHTFLVRVHDIYTFLRNKLKDFLVNHLPKVYLELRKMKHHKKTSNSGEA